MDGDGALPILGTMLGSETAVAALAAARRDRRTPTALVTIESRGGSALASEVIWRELWRLVGAAKPTRVYIDTVAASGGYLIACAASRILAAPLAIVGSADRRKFGGHFDFSGLLGWLGVRRDHLGRRRAGRGFTRSGALLPDEQSAVEALTDDTYQAFLALVAEARKQTKERVRELAQGKVYTGNAALPLGLLDRVCGFAGGGCRGGRQGRGDPPGRRAPLRALWPEDARVGSIASLVRG